MKTTRLLTAACLTLTLCGLSGCDDETAPDTFVSAPPETAEAESAADPEEGATAAQAGDDAPEAGAVVDDPTFEVRLTAADSYASGELGQFAVNIAAKGVYHMNQEFPTTVTVREVDGVAFPKAELEAGDAAEFGETSARFDVPFTASAAGEHRVVCDVSFAVCTDENCIPENRTLAVLLPVE